MKGRVTYSDAFRRGVVERVERGMYKSLSGASRRNGIRGSLTLVNRIKEYGREDIPPKRVKAGTVNEADELKAARKEIKELKAALADARIDRCPGSAFPDIARERPGTTAEDLKKRTP